MIKKRHHSPERKESKFSKKERLIAALSMPLAAVAIASCSHEVTLQIDSETGHLRNVDGPTPVETTTFKKGSELTREQRFALPPEEYYKLDESIRAADQAKYFTEGIKNVYRQVIHPDLHPNYLSKGERDALNNGTFYLPDLHKPRSEWTDQDYLNYFSLAMYFVTRQEKEYKRDALNALSVVVRPETGTFTNIEEHIKKHEGDVSIVSLYEAVPTEFSGYTFTPDDLGSISGDWETARVVGQRSLENGRVLYSIFVNYSDENQNAVSIVARTYASLNHPVFDHLRDRIR